MAQADLIRLMKGGKLLGETTQPKHVETVISNVFLFPERVYKFYKSGNEAFNKDFRDLSTRDARFTFTKRDFAWNSALSPQLYQRLQGIKVADGAIAFVDEGEAEELAFVMNRVDASNILFDKLTADTITEKDAFSIGKQFATHVARVQQALPEHDFFDVFASRVSDVRDWIALAVPHISADEARSYVDYLEGYRITHETWFRDDLTRDVSTDGDFQSHNSIYADGQFYLMDTFPPKEAWLVGHKAIALYREGTDIWALTGRKELFEAYMRGYEEGSGATIDRKLDEFLPLYVATISAPYLYILLGSNPTMREPAERYHAFMRERLAEHQVK